MHQVYSIALLFFFISTSGQAQEKSFSVTGGITNSSVPIYSQAPQSQLISNQSINSLSVTASYNQKLKKNFVLKSELSYKRIGGNSLNRKFDEEDFFIQNVFLDYLSVGALTYAEFHFGKQTLSLGFGPSASYLVKKQVVNFQFEDNVIVSRESEPIALDPIDLGLNVTVEVNRVIANNFKLIASLRRYQGLLDVNVEGLMGQIFLSNSVLSLGLECPLNK